MGEDAPILERPYCPPRQWQPCRTCELHLCHGDYLLYLHGLSDWNRATESRPNHFTGTTCPTLIKARVGNENRQIVAAAIAAGRCTGWAPGHVVSAHDPNFFHVIENAKSMPFRSELRAIARLGFRSDLCDIGWKLFAHREVAQLLFCYFAKPR